MQAKLIAILEARYCLQSGWTLFVTLKPLLPPLTPRLTAPTNAGVLITKAVELIVPPVAKGARPPLILPLRLPRFRFCVLWKEKKTDFHREIELYEDTKCLRR